MYAGSLRWLGVIDLPRDGILELAVEREFVLYAVRSLRYPVNFDDHSVPDADSVQAPFVKSVASIDGLSSILKRAATWAILTGLWLIERRSKGKLCK